MGSRSVGFTLIELMLVVTIIGILAAVAIPTYQGYIVRTKVSEGLLAATPAKLAVSDYQAQNGVLPVNNAEAGLPAPASMGTGYVSTVEVIAGGIVQVTFGDPALLNQTINLTPIITATSTDWTCTSSLPRNLTPATCR